MQRVAITPAIMEALTADITDNLVQLGGAVEQMAAPDGSGNYNITVVEAAMLQLDLRLRIVQRYDPTVDRYLVLVGGHFTSLARLGGHLWHFDSLATQAELVAPGGIDRLFRRQVQYNEEMCFKKVSQVEKWLQGNNKKDDARAITRYLVLQGGHCLCPLPAAPSRIYVLYLPDLFKICSWNIIF